jgi:hypothetical protein
MRILAGLDWQINSLRMSLLLDFLHGHGHGFYGIAGRHDNDDLFTPDFPFGFRPTTSVKGSYNYDISQFQASSCSYSKSSRFSFVTSPTPFMTWQTAPAASFRSGRAMISAHPFWPVQNADSKSFQSQL